MTSVCHVCTGIGRLADWSICPACGGRGFSGASSKASGAAVLEAEPDAANGSPSEVGGVFRIAHDQSYTHPLKPNYAFYVLRSEDRAGNPPGIYVIDPDYKHSVLRADLPVWRRVHALDGIPQDVWLQLKYVDGQLLPILLCFTSGGIYGSWLAA